MLLLCPTTLVDNASLFFLFRPLLDRWRHELFLNRFARDQERNQFITGGNPCASILYLAEGTRLRHFERHRESKYRSRQSMCIHTIPWPYAEGSRLRHFERRKSDVKGHDIEVAAG